MNDNVFHALEEPASLNALDVLPRLTAAGIRAVKVEGRQRSPAYVAQVTRLMRSALDGCLDVRSGAAPTNVITTLDGLAEGRAHTLGAYYRPWQ